MNTVTEPGMRQATQAPLLPSVAGTSGRLQLMVRQIRCEAIGINSYELVDPTGTMLPQAAAGAHIDLYLEGGIVRQYSLANDPADRHHYVIAVLRDETGRGGSKAVHASLQVRGLVPVSLPRNNFPVADEASRNILLAGGIGLTPLKAMAHHFERTGAEYVLHYCCKGEDFAVFSRELAPLITTGHVVMHFDGGKVCDSLDIGVLLQNHVAGTHLYYCGPQGFMDACARASTHWPAGSVHFEHFKTPQPRIDADAVALTAATTAADGFEVRIASTGQTLQVPESKTIVEVLRAAGIAIDTSCEAGLCGTCKVRFLSGEVDHRDFVLSDAEQHDYLTACVSRCNSTTLVLDL